MSDVDWVGAGGLYHLAVNRETACGIALGGLAVADHPCESCIALLFAAVATVPGLEADE